MEGDWREDEGGKKRRKRIINISSDDETVLNNTSIARSPEAVLARPETDLARPEGADGGRLARLEKQKQKQEEFRKNLEQKKRREEEAKKGNVADFDLDNFFDDDEFESQSLLQPSQKPDNSEAAQDDRRAEAAKDDRGA